MAVIKHPTRTAPTTEIINFAQPKPKIVQNPLPSLINESSYLNKLNKTIATPSFNVASPKARLNKLLFTCSCSIIAITATGSIADKSDEYAIICDVSYLMLNNGVEILSRIVIITVFTIVPITA